MHVFLSNNAQYRKTTLLVGGHWAATEVATGRPLGGHWAAIAGQLRMLLASVHTTRFWISLFFLFLVSWESDSCATYASEETTMSRVIPASLADPSPAACPVLLCWRPSALPGAAHAMPAAQSSVYSSWRLQDLAHARMRFSSIARPTSFRIVCSESVPAVAAKWTPSGRPVAASVAA